MIEKPDYCNANDRRRFSLMDGEGQTDDPLQQAQPTFDLSLPRHVESDYHACRAEILVEQVITRQPAEEKRFTVACPMPREW